MGKLLKFFHFSITQRHYEHQRTACKQVPRE